MYEKLKVKQKGKIVKRNHSICTKTVKYITKILKKKYTFIKIQKQMFMLNDLKQYDKQRLDTLGLKANKLIILIIIKKYRVFDENRIQIYENELQNSNQIMYLLMLVKAH